jgi:hypothetical protein
VALEGAQDSAIRAGATATRYDRARLGIPDLDLLSPRQWNAKPKAENAGKEGPVMDICEATLMSLLAMWFRSYMLYVSLMLHGSYKMAVYCNYICCHDFD